jgi:competence protein ComFC
MNARSDPEPSGWMRAASRFLDFLYPPSCALCDCNLTHGAALCGSCEAGLPRLAEPFCMRCGEMFHGEIDDAFECPNCHKVRFAFQFARPAMVRDESTLELVHRLKYGRQIHLAEPLGNLAFEAFKDPRLAVARDGGWPLVPVPLHPRRLRDRHFNQAAEIARVVGRLAGLPVIEALRRVRETDTQTRLSRKQRMENLRGAFEVSRGGRKWLDGRPPGAVIVDDVLTTGSTVNACARVLRRAGLRRLVVVTVMRG